MARYEFRDPSMLEDDEIEDILTRSDELTSWASDIKDYAFRKAMEGKVWTHHKLVAGRSVRKFSDDTLAAQVVVNAGFDPYEKKLLGITAMTRMLGKTKFEEILGGLVTKPPGKPTLVPESDKRPAIEVSTPQEDFQEGNKMSNLKNPTKVITGTGTRWSYCNAWEPKAINGGTPKYSVSLIIPKSDEKTVAKVKAAIQAAYEEGSGKLKGNGRSVPALDAIKTPLRDGDLERPDDAAYANAYFVNANSTTAPGIVDADRQEIIDHSEVYSGVYGRASISFYAFNSSGNRGIACGLNNLQKIKDGEPLGSRISAEDDFADEDEGFLD